MAPIPAGYCCEVRYVAQCLPTYSCCVEAQKRQLICCEVAVSLGNGENVAGEGTPAWKYAVFPSCGFNVLCGGTGRRTEGKVYI